MSGSAAERHITSDGTAIAWRSLGPSEATPLLLLHSLGFDGRMWEPQVEALAGDHRVVIMDLRGHGASEAPAGLYSMERLALDALEVADAAGLDRFHLCGLSIGGQMAQWIAIHRPERMRALVLADTAARIGSAEAWQERIDTVLTAGMEAIAPGVLERWFSAGFKVEQPARYAEARERLLTTSPTGYAGCCAALAGSDLRGEVTRIGAPTLVIAGREDLPTPPAEARWLHDAIEGSELALLEGAAHISNLDAEEVFTRLLREFLGRFPD